MRPLKKLISGEEALQLILGNVEPMADKEEADIGEATERILAEDITSPFDVPNFDRSAMDGYAVRAEETFGATAYGPRILSIKGEVFAGEDKDFDLGDNECVGISTGAKLPASCDAVVMVENTEQRIKGVLIYKPVYPFENVSKRGEDIKAGDAILKKSELLNPSKIGAMAALGIEKAHVFKKPKISIISTGNEVVPLGSPLAPGKVYDINTYTVKSVVETNFCTPIIRGIVSDEKAKLKRAIRDGLENDMVVVSGGSSVGERDVLIDILGEYTKFHGMRVRPGKPTLFAIVDGKPVLGLPGYPASCLTNAYLFLAPALRKMAQAPMREEKVIRARMDRRIRSVLGRKEYLTVRVEDGVAHSVYKQSSAITSLAHAMGYVVIDETVDLLDKDDEVDVRLFNWRG